MIGRAADVAASGKAADMPQRFSQVPNTQPASPDPGGLPFPEGLRGLRAAAERCGQDVARGGGKVVGLAPSLAPIELVEGAGLTAIAVTGGGVSSTPRADTLMESLFHPPVRAILERLMRGDFSYLSAIVLPRTSDAEHRLYYYLCELARMGVDLPQALLFDVSLVPGEAARAYAGRRVRALWLELCALAGSEPDEERLARAIEASNRRRSILATFLERRRAAPLDLPAEQALAAIAAAGGAVATDIEARLARLREPDLSAQTGPRVLITGNAHEDPGLHAAIEAAGGVVVGDHHGLGDLGLGPTIATDRAPLEALTDHYRAAVAAVRSFSGPQALARHARECGAAGVVFSYFAEEEALTWDFPGQARALQEQGLAVLRLGAQAYPFDPEASRLELSAFIERLAGSAP